LKSELKSTIDAKSYEKANGWLGNSHYVESAVKLPLSCENFAYVQRNVFDDLCHRNEVVYVYRFFNC
jgi:hypothetical protein